MSSPDNAHPNTIDISCPSTSPVTSQCIASTMDSDDSDDDMISTPQTHEPNQDYSTNPISTIISKQLALIAAQRKSEASRPMERNMFSGLNSDAADLLRTVVRLECTLAEVRRSTTTRSKAAVDDVEDARAQQAAPEEEEEEDIPQPLPEMRRRKRKTGKAGKRRSGSWR